ncbi:transketolase [Fulvivirgaceae bacterium BMA10]|uniref:Transketolase n=1 Tax=Splendidivirga corallicola TaxID=3051826 RepID=A0ABT8KUY5_9BACT|nr:transketolase [Fulvivirgaceae bacterium BMA10]
MIKEIDELCANNISVLAAAMVEKAKSGHPGGAMGGADFLHILYSEFLQFDPDDMHWAFRDRLFMDAGHLSALLYAQMYLFGKYTKTDIENFRQWGSCTPGHPELDIERGIENTSGPLGQGHVLGIGAAIAERFLASQFGEWMTHKTYLYITDGGIQEEISQGAGRIAGFLGLNNVIMFYDSNDIQLSTRTEEVTCENTAMKYESWGWKVKTIDAHDHWQIREALKEANAETEQPFLIIGKTIMGKGAIGEKGESWEGKFELHGQPLSAAGASFRKTIENLGGNADTPFNIHPDVSTFYQRLYRQKVENAAVKKSEEKKWRSNNPKLSEKLDGFLSGKIPDIDFGQIEQKADQATRAASSTVLGYLADHVENMIVSSADLSNSDKTDGFLKKTKAMHRQDYSGRFLQAGVSELTMASLANGMALHGGVIPVVGTFFVFSDYMKPAVRLAALMELPVKFLWTHDSFRVGEDGPTHQPIEQEAQIRLMEKVQNHSGKPSVLALRPSDSHETTIAWKMALANNDTPTALIFSRQNINDLPAKTTGNRYKEALGAELGAYKVLNVPQPDVLLIASGSEVSTLVEAAELLVNKDGIRAEVISVISQELFYTQTEEYQNTVIDKKLPKYGLTAGLSISLRELVGQDGRIHGIDHFGYSAPAAQLNQKFGFTGEQVYIDVKAFLKDCENKVLSNY